MEAEPGHKVGEQFGEGRHANHRGDQDEGSSCAAELCREDLTDDDLKLIFLKIKIYLTPNTKPL